MANIEDENTPISKSQRKRDMHFLQSLGESLIQLPNQILIKLNLPELLEDAVLDAKSIQHHGAKRRHVQYIGRLIRQLDSIDLLIKIETAIKHSSDSDVADPAVEKCRTWSERYLTNTEEYFLELIETFPQVDRQRLHQFARQSMKEKQKNKPPHAERALFQYLLDLEKHKT